MLSIPGAQDAGHCTLPSTSSAFLRPHALMGCGRLRAVPVTARTDFMIESAPAAAQRNSWIAKSRTGDLLLVQTQSGGTLAMSLDSAGVRTDFAYSRLGACTMAKRHRYTAIAVLGRPAGTTIQSLRRAAGNGIDAPMIAVLLPFRSTVMERLEQHARGADICLDDWTDVEVVTRIQAWERRRKGTVPRSWLAAGVRLQVGPNAVVYLGSIPIKLSHMQRAILAAIILAGDEGIAPASLREKMSSRSLTYGAVRVHICSIRKTLLSYQMAPRLVLSEGSYRIERHSAGSGS